MSMDESEYEYETAVTKYDRLCEERNDNRFWSENITEATTGITSRIAWQNFYSYLGDSSHEYTDKWARSLGEEVDEGLTLQYGDQQFKTETVQNGNVTIIKMTPDNLNLSNKTYYGEQMASISERGQEEKSDT